MSWNRRPLIFLPLLAALVAAGCGETHDPTYPVTGKVTLNGQPLTTGTVTFTPENGPSATGEIGADGTYSLITPPEREGAMPGTYQVSVSAVEVDAEGLARSLLPSKYSAGQTSGLTATVQADKENTVNLDLTGPARR